jgi:signal transduction histidine kinase
MAMRLNYARMLLEKDPQQTAEELAHVEELARRTTKEIRHMLFTLRPLILETQGLRAAMVQYISKLAETDPTPIHLEAVSGVDQSLDRNAQGVIFYILEEAIGNARKHAKAKNLWVRLYIRDNNTFIAEVQDDGRVNGKLTIVSAPGEGTRITLTAPLPGR